MAEKPKLKPAPRQASLMDASEDAPDEIDKLVAQAFDSDPKIRLQVANSLSKSDDPRAIFALVELSSDKDESVKEAALRALGNFKEEKEEILTIGKLLSERKASPPPEAPEQAAPKAEAKRTAASMLPAIEKLFSHYEPKKREMAKRKLLPSLQKIFGFKPEELDPLRELDRVWQDSSAPASGAREEKPAKEGGEVQKNAENFPYGKHQEPQEASFPKMEIEISDDDAELVGREGGAEPSQKEGSGLSEPDEIYHYALHMATTPGIGKVELKREQNRLISEFKRRVELAFKLASAQAKEEGFASFLNVKPGMRNLSFSKMAVVSVSETPYGNRRKPYMRIVLSDGKREMPLYVPAERAHGITTADMVEVKKAVADFLVDRKEVILIATPKSQIIVHK